jgi:hypothetical protein
VALIGWRGICQSEVGDTTFAAQARRNFESARLRAQEGQRYAAITGFDMPALQVQGRFQPVGKSAQNPLSLFEDRPPTDSGSQIREASV